MHKIMWPFLKKQKALQQTHMNVQTEIGSTNLNFFYVAFFGT
jgi:hypothetical protein